MPSQHQEGPRRNRASISNQASARLHRTCDLTPKDPLYLWFNFSLAKHHSRMWAWVSGRNERGFTRQSKETASRHSPHPSLCVWLPFDIQCQFQRPDLSSSVPVFSFFSVFSFSIFLCFHRLHKEQRPTWLVGSLCLSHLKWSRG